jgi:uncharacterized protein
MFKGYKTKKIKIKGKYYRLWIANNDRKRRLGLSNIKKLPPRTGMLFYYDDDVHNSFTMKNTSMSLTIIFLDKNGDIVDVHKVPAHYKHPIISKKPYRFVIEI